MRFKYVQPVLGKNPNLVQCLKDPSSLTEEQWDKLFEATDYDRYITPTPKKLSDFGGFLGMMGLKDPLNVLANTFHNKFQDIAKNPQSLIHAASNGQIEFMQMLDEKATNSFHDVVKSHGPEALKRAILENQLGALKFLKEKMPNIVDEISKESNPSFISEFKSAKPSYEVMYWLLQHPSFFVFVETLEPRYQAGHFDNQVYSFIFETLTTLGKERDNFLKLAPSGVFDLQDSNRIELCLHMLRFMIARSGESRFEDNIRFLLMIPVVKTRLLEKLTPTNAKNYLKYSTTNAQVQLKVSLPNDPEQAFRLLCEREKTLEVDQSAAYYQDFHTFQVAAFNGDMEKLQRLADIVPHLMQDMIKEFNYGAFKHAVERKHVGVINWLLQHPSCFVYAEQNGYENQVTPFITTTLALLREEQQVLVNINPNAVFDLKSPSRAELCFYMLRNLMKRNDRTLDDSIRFLLTLPAVKAIAHLGSMPNELFNLALSMDNSELAILLLDNEKVRRELVTTLPRNNKDNPEPNAVKQSEEKLASENITTQSSSTKQVEGGLTSQGFFQKDGLGKQAYAQTEQQASLQKK